MVELVILAPAIAGLLLAFGLWARIALAKLALIQLTRDTALLIARDRDLWSAGPQRQTQAMRRLATGRGLARPEDLTLRLSKSWLPSSGSSPDGELGASLGVGSLISGFLVGKKVTLSYTLPRQGLLAFWLPQGYAIHCSVTVLGDPWDFGQGLSLSKFTDLLSGSP